MKQYCFLMHLKADCEDEYKRRHDNIWPELLVEIQDAGMVDFVIWRDGLTLIATFKCWDIDKTFDRLGQGEANQRWSKYFEDILEPFPDAEGPKMLPKIWCLEESVRRRLAPQD